VGHDLTPAQRIEGNVVGRFALIWLLAGFVVILLTLQMTIASFIDGQYLPVGHDAFYHGRRILDAVQTGHLYQFDPHIHVPQGDWITWPWAYDFVLAKLVRVVMTVTGASDPAAILMHVPQLFGFLAAGLVVGVCAELELPPTLTVIAALCFALHAFTQGQFGVGSLDHHGAEQMATLGVLWLGLRWLRQPASALRAALLGLGLGAAIGIHAGLFILQVPLVAALLLCWLRGDPLRGAAAGWFAAGLLTGTLLILVPAETFWQKRYVIYYLSLLHLHLAIATSIVVNFLCRTSFGKRNLAILVVLGLVLAAPLASIFDFSTGFLAGRLAAIEGIDEIQSPYAATLQPHGLQRIDQVYTLLIWIAPLTLLAALAMAWREKTAARAYFWLAAAFGLALMLLQLRFGSFGVAYLYLPLLVLAAYATTRWPAQQNAVVMLMSGVMLVAYYPTLRYQLFGARTPAMDQQYATVRPLLATLRKACQEDPGIVLAEPGDGHVIRYFTDCSVIANNFRLTPLDGAKIDEAFSLIGQPLETVRRRFPEVKYVVARLVAPVETEHPVLFLELLSSKGPRPPGVETLVEVAATQKDGHAENFLGVFRLTGPPAAAPLAP